MKFLLTSNGISNVSIEKALFELLGKKADETTVVFVPTAATLIADDKSWLIKNFQYFVNRGFKSIDIVDISAVPRENWLRRFETADLLCFGGGDEQYLAKVMRESGVAEELSELLESRVYMGISAGSMVVGKLLPSEVTKVLWPEESFVGNEEGLSLYDFSILPHLNSEYFAHLRTPLIESMKDQFPHTIYALDDASALKIVDNQIEVMTEGEFFKLENNV
jgi:dipeptidase E